MTGVQTCALPIFAVEELGVDIAPKLQRLKVAEPKPRSGGVKVQSVAELVAKLKNEAKVI